MFKVCTNDQELVWRRYEYKTYILVYKISLCLIMLLAVFAHTYCFVVVDAHWHGFEIICQCFDSIFAHCLLTFTLGSNRVCFRPGCVVRVSNK